MEMLNSKILKTKENTIHVEQLTIEELYRTLMKGFDNIAINQNDQSPNEYNHA